MLEDRDANGDIERAISDIHASHKAVWQRDIDIVTRRNIEPDIGPAGIGKSDAVGLRLRRDNGRTDFEDG